jgi:hypothetical protein
MFSRSRVLRVAAKATWRRRTAHFINVHGHFLLMAATTQLPERTLRGFRKQDMRAEIDFRYCRA